MFLLFIYWQDSPSFRDELKVMLEASGVREYFRYVFIYLSGVWTLIINKFFPLSFSRSRGLSDLSLPWKNPTAEGKEAADQRRKKYFSQVREEERKINDRRQNILKFLFFSLFSQISKSDVMSLYHKYRADHELFGYGIEPYLSLAKSSGND